MFQHRYNMFPSDSQLWSFMTLFTARAGSAACVIIGKTATATQRRNNTTKQSNHIKAISKLYSNPSRIQSNISVLTEIEVTLQSIQDTEYLHKTQTRFRKLTWMRRDTIYWSFQDTIHENSAALPSIPIFCTAQGLLCDLGSYIHCKLQKENYVTST